MEFTEVVTSNDVESCEVLTKKYVRRPEQLKYIEYWKSSGLSRQAFCHRYHIAQESFDRWLKPVKADVDRSSSMISPQTSFSPSMSSFSIELTLPNGVLFQVKSDMPVRELLTLINGVGQCKFN